MRQRDCTRTNVPAASSHDGGDRVAVMRGQIGRAYAQRIVSVQQPRH